MHSPIVTRTSAITLVDLVGRSQTSASRAATTPANRRKADISLARTWATWPSDETSEPTSPTGPCICKCLILHAYSTALQSATSRDSKGLGSNIAGYPKVPSFSGL
jgi:hypothetical protein